MISPWSTTIFNIICYTNHITIDFRNFTPFSITISTEAPRSILKSKLFFKIIQNVRYRFLPSLKTGVAIIQCLTKVYTISNINWRRKKQIRKISVSLISKASQVLVFIFLAYLNSIIYILQKKNTMHTSFLLKIKK